MISLEEVKKLALLARIELDKKEAEELQKDLGAILDYISQLKKAPPSSRLAGLRRTSPAGAEEIGTPTNVFREDEPVIDESEVKKGKHIKVKHIL